MSQNLFLKILSKMIFNEFFVSILAIIRHLRTQILPQIKNLTTISGHAVLERGTTLEKLSKKSDS